VTAHQPTVSVILPIFNGASYLAKAIESVLQQTFADLELIAVDDGSSDKSVAIVESYPQVRLHRQPNSGVAATRNVGLKLAAGDLLGFIDQDDIWMPDKLARQVAYLGENPRVDIVTGDELILLAPGVTRPGWLRPELLAAPHPTYVPSALLIRRCALDTVGGFGESFRCGSDTDWLCRARDSGVEIRTLPGVVIQKRVHTNNESQNVKICQNEIVSLLRDSIRRKRNI